MTNCADSIAAGFQETIHAHKFAQLHGKRFACVPLKTAMSRSCTIAWVRVPFCAKLQLHAVIRNNLRVSLLSLPLALLAKYWLPCLLNCLTTLDFSKVFDLLDPLVFRAALLHLGTRVSLQYVAVLRAKNWGSFFSLTKRRLASR